MCLRAFSIFSSFHHPRSVGNFVTISGISCGSYCSTIREDIGPIFSVRLLIIKDGYTLMCAFRLPKFSFSPTKRSRTFIITPPPLKSTFRQHLTTPTQILLSNIIILLLYGKGNRWGLPLDFISNCCYIEITQKRNK